MSKCVSCGGKLLVKKDRKIMIEVGNPMQVPVESTFEECQKCGERLFDINESIRLQKIIDIAMNDTNPTKVKIGKKVEIEK